MRLPLSIILTSLLSSLLLFSDKSHAQSVQAFVGATLINPGQAPLENAVVLVKDGRILGAGSATSVVIPKDAKRIDVKGKWISPGLFDAHIHFFQSGSIYTRPDALDLRKAKPYEEERAQIRANLQDTFARYLRSGITSVIDMGGPNWNFEVKELANKTQLAPRVWLTGPLLTPSAIKNFRVGGPHFLTEGNDPPVLHDMSPEQARAEVRRQHSLKADFIKIWVSRNLTTPTQHAIYDEAKKLGLKVAVHATKLSEASEAVKAGANILVHDVEDALIPDEMIQEMKAKNVVLIPTLAVYRGYTMLRTQRFAFEPWEYALANPYVMGTFFDLMHVNQPSSEAQIKQIQDAKVWEANPITLENVRRLVRGGVTVAAGTDAGNPGAFPGASIFVELKLMQQAGLTPAEILESVTLSGAKVLDKEKDFGSVAVGKVADLLILNANPLQDIQNLQQLFRIVKGGEILQPDHMISVSPEDVVQRQLNAYNARDTEAFALTYAPNVTIRTIPESASNPSGRDYVKSRWGEMFLKRPDSAVRIPKRITQGPFVIDQEDHMHRWDPKKTGPAGTAIYEVRDGLIQTVWFLKNN